MERIVKTLFLTILVLNLFPQCGNSAVLSNSLTSSQNISFENCTKVFNTDNISLFYLTIASVNNNKFQLEEIQSRSGYILFKAVGRKYLATIVNVNTNQSMLKITPVDNNYVFQPGIISNMFNFITQNVQVKPEIIVFN